MQRRSRTDQILLVILGVVLVTTLILLPFHAFLSTWAGTAIGPLLIWKSWKEILLFVSVPFVVWLCVLRPDIVAKVWHGWLSKLILAYVALHALWAVLSPASLDAVLAGLLMNLRFLAIFVLAQVLVAGNPRWLAKIKIWLVGWLLATGTLLAVLAIIQVTIIPREFLTQFGYDKHTTIAPYLLVDDNPDALRAFATLRGPNTLGAYLLLPLALALVLWGQNRHRWWAAGSGGLMVIALACTGSRSAWIGAAAMLAALAFAMLPRDKLLRWLKWGTVPAIVAVGLFVWLAISIPQLRLAIFHSGGNTQDEPLLEGSTQDHWMATLAGLQSIAEQPVGQGVGTAGPASFYNTNSPANIAENYFVQVGQETGVAGLALFIVISVAVWRMLWRERHALWPGALLASFIGIHTIGIFLHGWADDPTAMTWWALAGLFVVSSKQK